MPGLLSRWQFFTKLDRTDGKRVGGDMGLTSTGVIRNRAMTTGCFKQKGYKAFEQGYELIKTCEYAATDKGLQLFKTVQTTARSINVSPWVRERVGD